MPPSVEEIAERFPQLEVLELVGKGGMGAVYKARQKELDRLVAVKILPPDVAHDPAFAGRFTREARALARLSHPNIVAIYDFGRTPLLPSPLGRGVVGEGAGSEGAGGERPAAEAPLFYLVMEYVDGVNLRQAIQSGGISPREALAIVPQICDALQFAHDEGIVHRDIKPENVLVDKRGRAKIADFGLAKLLGHAPGDVSLTGTQQVMGTLRYMAPEQMEGTKAVDHRADIYSLGVVFYELLTGELPIGRFPPPSKKVQIDVRLDEVVLRTLENDPERRYQRARDVKTDVEAVRSAGRDLGPAMTRSPGGGPSSDGIRAAHVLTAMGALTVASGVFTFLLLVGAFVDTYHFDRFFRQDSVLIPLLVMQALAIPAGVLMVMGGLWPAPQGSPWSRFAAALGLVPLTPAWLITLPLALWSLAVLSKPEVTAAFARGATTEVEMLPGRHSPWRSARLLVTLAAWTALVAGLCLWLLPPIMMDWWPWRYNERWEIGLTPQSGAYPSVRLTGERRLYCWGQCGADPDRLISKKPWIAAAEIDVGDAEPGATLALDGFREQWRWTTRAGQITQSQDEPRPEDVAEWMQDAGIDAGKPGVREEAAALVDLLKDAANGVLPGDKRPRDYRAVGRGASIGPFTADGVSGWGFQPLGMVGLSPDMDRNQVQRRWITAAVFLAAWLPGLLILARRRRRRVAAAWEKGPERRVPEAGQVKSHVESISSRGSSSAPAQAPPAEAPSLPAGDAGSQPTPRFSRKAIWGAVWAALFFVALLSWVSVMRIAEGADQGPQWWQWVLLFTLLPLGATGPFGATILGVVSLSEIRHSRGRLIGLPLALADALLFPLLLLDVLIWLACYYSVAENRFLEEFVPVAILVGLFASLAVDFAIVFWAWRWAARDSEVERGVNQDCGPAG